MKKLKIKEIAGMFMLLTLGFAYCPSDLKADFVFTTVDDNGQPEENAFSATPPVPVGTPFELYPGGPMVVESPDGSFDTENREVVFNDEPEPYYNPNPGNPVYHPEIDPNVITPNGTWVEEPGDCLPTIGIRVCPPTSTSPGTNPVTPVAPVSPTRPGYGFGSPLMLDLIDAFWFILNNGNTDGQMWS